MSQARSDSVCVCRLQILKAQILIARNPQEALKLLAAPPPPQLVGTEFPVRREMLLGEGKAAIGAVQEAETHLQEAERLAESTAPELLAKVALAEGNLANQKKDQQHAEAEYTRALGLARKYGQESTELDALIDLGYALVQRERFDEGMDRFSAALRKARALHVEVAEEAALGNLAYCYLELGNSDQSILLLEEAEAAASKLGEKRHQQLWSELQGNAYLGRHEYSKAETHYSMALSFARDLKDQDLIVLAYHNLAQLELERGRTDKAEEYNRDAFAAEGLQPDDRSDPYLVLTTAEIEKARQKLPKAEELLHDVLQNKSADSSLHWQAQSDLADVYVAQKRLADAEREFDKAVQIIEQASGDIKQEERRMSILDAWPFYDDYIRFLIDQGKAEKALQIAEFSRARTLSEAFRINAHQRVSSLQIPLVKKFLAAQKQIILAYWLADRQSYLWVVTPTSLQVFPLPGKDEIEQAIQNNDRQILKEHTEVGNSSAGRQLYEILVKPAENLIPKNARVTIVPHRSLYRVNFETLVTPGPKPHYWIEDVQVENASSIALLTSSRRKPGPPLEGMLLVGAPKEVTKDFAALKHATEELKKVQNHFSDAKVIAGSAATPSAYRQSDPERYRMIDFVSHGTASEMSPLDSAIILSSESDGSYKLYAREIKDIPLRADLVTISACYGMGSKTYSGEGTVGLSWAFMRAGAHQVIGALWEVDETSSPQLMDDFYGELTSGKSVAQALRDAKLKMLQSESFYRHPYYWGSLQLYTGS